MTETPLEQWADALERRFGAQRPIRVYRQTGSTQDVARQWIADQPESAAGVLVVAGHQTTGRGRLGRKWHSPPGAALTFTSVHRVDQATIDRVTFAVSVALAQTLDRWLTRVGLATAIKWPNDIYVDGRKLAGILVEVTDGLAVVGVGINVGLTTDALPQELRQRATSLAICGVDADRLAVLCEVVEAMGAAIHKTGETQLLEAWRSKCGMLHHDVRLGHDGQVIEGRVIDLDPREGLIVRRVSGEIVHLPSDSTTVL